MYWKRRTFSTISHSERLNSIIFHTRHATEHCWWMHDETVKYKIPPRFFKTLDWSWVVKLSCLLPKGGLFLSTIFVAVFTMVTARVLHVTFNKNIGYSLCTQDSLCAFCLSCWHRNSELDLRGRLVSALQIKVRNKVWIIYLRGIRPYNDWLSSSMSSQNNVVLQQRIKAPNIIMYCPTGSTLIKIFD